MELHRLSAANPLDIFCTVRHHGRHCEVGLFTNVPVGEALQAISSRLQQDKTLGEQTNIPTLELCHLVELCLRSTYFQFGASFFLW